MAHVGLKSALFTDQFLGNDGDAKNRYLPRLFTTTLFALSGSPRIKNHVFIWLAKFAEDVKLGRLHSPYSFFNSPQTLTLGGALSLSRVSYRQIPRETGVNLMNRVCIKNNTPSSNQHLVSLGKDVWFCIEMNAYNLQQKSGLARRGWVR